MLPRQFRLPAENFPKVYKEGATYYSSSFILKKLRKNQKNTRFAFVVSKKISQKSTVRHKITRKAREAVRLLLPSVFSNLDIIIIAKPSAIKNIEKIPQEIKSLLNKAKVFKNE